MNSEKNEEMWRRNLSPLAYKVTREHATEPAFSYSEKHTSNGHYTCVCCGSLLFDNADKFESGSGWPSFTKPASGAEIGETTDRSYNMTRTEVHCSNCEAHLGHLFPDGPGSNGLRYCVNGVALTFEGKNK